MTKKDFSEEGTIKLIPLTEKPEKDSIVAMSLYPFPLMVIGDAELEGTMCIREMSGRNREGIQIRVPISGLSKIIVEYQYYDGMSQINDQYVTKQLPLDADQWNYVLQHNMINSQIRFETVSKKNYDETNGVTFGKWEARIVIGKKLFTDEELIEMGEACYNFRNQQQEGKTNVSFREWFKSKFL